MRNGANWSPPGKHPRFPFLHEQPNIVRTMHILVVNDRRSEVWFIERVLQKLGLSVESAFDGVEALQKVEQSVPSLVILDTIMPKMDGYTFYKILRTGAKTSSIPVIVATDKGREYEIPKLSEPAPKSLLAAKQRTPGLPAGQTIFVNKPINPEDLENQIRCVINRDCGNHDEIPAARRSRVLIIDDDEQFCARIVQSLQELGIQTFFASGGLAGLSKLKENTPDFVILDTILPELNGLQVLRYIKQHFDIPVMMIPGRAEADLLNQALRFGADCYMIKPFEPDTLAGFIQKKLKRREIQAQPVS